MKPAAGGLTLVRVGLAGLAGLAAVVAGAVPAAALPILEPADAEELAAALAEATEDQDVCYGWEVEVVDDGGGGDGVDFGSSLGAGKRATSAPEVCERYVVLRAQIVYTSSLSESEDFVAGYEVSSNVTGAPTADDLARLGIRRAGLLGGSDDEVLSNAVLALPGLAAEAGIAPAIELEPNTAKLPAGDGATGTPGSDWMRRYGSTVAFLAAVIAAGVAWAGWIVWHDRPFSRRRPHQRSHDPGGPDVRSDSGLLE